MTVVNLAEIVLLLLLLTRLEKWKNWFQCRTSALFDKTIINYIHIWHSIAGRVLKWNQGIDELFLSFEWLASAAFIDLHLYLDYLFVCFSFLCVRSESEMLKVAFHCDTISFVSCCTKLMIILRIRSFFGKQPQKISRKVSESMMNTNSPIFKLRRHLLTLVSLLKLSITLQIKQPSHDQAIQHITVNDTPENDTDKWMIFHEFWKTNISFCASQMGWRHSLFNFNWMQFAEQINGDHLMWMRCS